MDHDALIAQNLKAWEEVAPIHASHNQARLLEAFSRPGHSNLDETATARLKALGIEGKDVVQICCNNGSETVSLANMGARRVVGVDGVDAFLEQGRALARRQPEMEFISSDAMDLPERLHEQFDLVFITIGVLSWMPDLGGFISGASALLRSGGTLLIYEHHPILEMLEPGAAGDPIAWELSYFSKEPYVDQGGLDYYGGSAYEATPNLSFMHTMSDLIMAGVSAGLVLTHFEEYPHHISNTWYNVEEAKIGLPMCFTLEMRQVDLKI